MDGGGPGAIKLEPVMEGWELLRACYSSLLLNHPVCDALKLSISVLTINFIQMTLKTSMAQGQDIIS